MGKHAEWRKLAKKARRKRIRQSLAKERDRIEEEARQQRESCPAYQKWLEEQRKAEEFQAEEEARLAASQHAHWLKVEEEAQKQWQELQKKLEQAREVRQRQNAKIKLEWEKEQQKLKELKELKQKEAEKRQQEEERLTAEIEDFITNGGDTPEHLKTSLETNPNKPVCPFFKKTSTCRFRDNCSRNHVRPGVSKILLIPNFYSHYSLEQSENEHGSDSNLEFESDELYNDFKEFFYDVVPELETCGRISQFKVCCNHEPHLRGNVYIEYEETRSAVRCYRRFNGRYYGGKQLNIEFCSIESWKFAICGLFFQRKCPKGSACNFLHVFKNPNNLFHHFDKDHHRRKEERLSEQRVWRWSESPERNDHLGGGNHRNNEHSDEDSWENHRHHSSRSKEVSCMKHSSQRKPIRSRSQSRSRRKRKLTRSRSRNSKHSRSRSKSHSRRSHRSSSRERLKSKSPSKYHSNSSKLNLKRSDSRSP